MPGKPLGVAGPTLWRAISLAALAMVAYLGSVASEIVYDDRLAVASNPVVTGQVPLFEAFARDHAGISGAQSQLHTYRPVSVAALAMAWTVTGGDPHGMHAAKVLLHALVVVATYLVLRGLVGEGVSLASSALFAVLAAPSEAVHTLVGTADMLAAVFCLLGLAFHRRSGWRSTIAAALCFALALGSKESAVVAPVAWLLADWLFPRDTAENKSYFVQLPAYGLVVALVVFARWRVFATLALPPVTELLNPLATAPFLNRLLGAGEVFASRYLLGIIQPARRLYDCSYAACMPARVANEVAWLGVTFALGFAIFPVFARRRSASIALGLFWFTIFFFPTSNFLVAASSVYGERWLYGPAMGLCLALAGAIEWASHRVQRPAIAWGMLAAFGIGNLAALQRRHQDWKNQRALFLSGLDYAADSAVVQRNLAALFLASGDAAQAEEHARRAVEIDPQFTNAELEWARALELQGRFGESEKHFGHVAQVEQSTQSISHYATFLARHRQFGRAWDVVHSALARHPNERGLEELKRSLERDLSAETKAERAAPGH